MTEVTINDRRKELSQLLRKMQAEPSRDWTEGRQRAAVLRQMVAAAAEEMPVRRSA